MNLQDTELRSLAPDAVVVNYLRRTNQELLRQLVAADVAVVVLDTEGGVLESTDAYCASLAPDERVRDGVAAVCTWGPALRSAVLDAGLLRPEQMVVTGSPRFDFYAPAWRPTALAASTYAEGYRRPLILLNGTFSLANPAFTTAEGEARSLVDDHGCDAAEVRRWLAAQRTSMAGLAALANRLAARFPDVTFVYRPHPFEGLAAYQELLEDRPNLHLVKHGSVDGWVLRASAVVQRGCTTALEATMAGVPALSPRWLPADVEMVTAEQASIACPTPEGLEATVARILGGDDTAGGALRHQAHRLIAAWLHDIDGMAHLRVAQVVRAQAAPRERAERIAGCRRVGAPSKELPLHLRASLGARFLLKRRLPPAARTWLRPSRTSWDRSGKRFGPDDVRRLLLAMSLSSTRLADVAPGIRVGGASDLGHYGPRHHHGRSVSLTWSAP